MINKKHLIKLLVLCAAMLAMFAVTSAAATLGDVDGNGKIEAADARLALRASVNLEKYAAGSAEFSAADVDGDKAVTAADARLILRASVNLEKLGHVHTYGAWTKETRANGTATGNHYRVCACGDKQVEACKFGEKVITSANKTPTCTKSTNYTTTCTVCGYKKAGGEAALGHNYVATTGYKAPTCTDTGIKPYKCSRCSATKNETIPAKGHKCKGQEFNINSAIKCTVCGQTVLPSFNDLVNTLKNGSHRFTSFDYDVTYGEVTKNNITLNALLQGFMSNGDLDKMLKESFAEKTESYSALVENRSITQFSFPITNTAYVSELKNEDVVSFTVTPMNSIDFVGELPASAKIYVTSNSYRNYDMTSIKAKAAHKVNKVEITIPQEKYSDFKNNSTQTALMRISGLDIRILANTISAEAMGDIGGLGLDMEGAETALSMKLNEITTDFTLTYYLDAVTNEPLAAIYDLRFSADERISMALSMDLSEVIPGMGVADLISGSLDMIQRSDSSTYYFFDGYFK